MEINKALHLLYLYNTITMTLLWYSYYIVIYLATSCMEYDLYLFLTISINIG